MTINVDEHGQEELGNSRNDIEAHAESKCSSGIGTSLMEEFDRNLGNKEVVKAIPLGMPQLRAIYSPRSCTHRDVPVKMSKRDLFSPHH